MVRQRDDPEIRVLLSPKCVQGAYCAAIAVPEERCLLNQSGFRDLDAYFLFGR